MLHAELLALVEEVAGPLLAMGRAELAVDEDDDGLPLVLLRPKAAGACPLVLAEAEDGVALGIGDEPDGGRTVELDEADREVLEARVRAVVEAVLAGRVTTSLEHRARPGGLAGAGAWLAGRRGGRDWMLRVALELDGASEAHRRGYVAVDDAVARWAGHERGAFADPSSPPAPRRFAAYEAGR